MHPYNLNQLQEKIPSGESYLVQIDPTTNDKTKTIFLENYRYKMEKPFLANFFALNCEFEVFRGKMKLHSLTDMPKKFYYQTLKDIKMILMNIE